MDIIRVFGSNVKHYRQSAGLSQETFAEKCGMHRTYISAIECFRRSISLENIQRIADSLGVEAYQLLVQRTEAAPRPEGIGTLSRQYLRPVPLPEDLTVENIFSALELTQDFFTLIRENTQINLSTMIQANNFSGIVSNVFTKKLSDVSLYHSYHDQKYPDLMHVSKQIGLEVKASNKPLKGGEGHNGHSGWHIVVCYHILENGDITFTHVEIADLIGYERPDPDWKYLGSHRNSNHSQRTETYITTSVGTAKLRDGSVYLDPRFVTITPALSRFRRNITEILPIPPHSPFAD